MHTVDDGKGGVFFPPEQLNGYDGDERSEAVIAAVL